MTLDPEQLKRAFRAIERWLPFACPVCKREEWAVMDTLYEMREFTSHGRLSLGGKVIPSLPVLCKTCGYTLLFNAVQLGLAVQPSPEPPPAHDPLGILGEAKPK